jgi:LysM repeat protein
MSLAKKFGIFLIVLCILFSGLAFNVKPAQAASCTAWYTVQKGDTLAKIGRMYGVSWQYLAKINHIPNPNKIYPGQVLCVSTTGQSKPPKYAGIPTIWIVSVVRDSTVTVTGKNFPPHVNFDVLMGPYGTKGVGGYYVTSFNSGQGGTWTKTFAIPSALYGSKKIAIRTDSYIGFYSYNWFWNNTAY